MLTWVGKVKTLYLKQNMIISRKVCTIKSYSSNQEGFVSPLGGIQISATQIRYDMR